MARPLWEVADVIRMAGSKLLERLAETLSWGQLKVLHAIVSCRTAALGGHRDRCANCGYQAISFFSCRNRHCPKCQVNARENWLRNRQQELLPVGLLSHCFQRATSPGPVDLAKQETPALSFLPGYRGYSHGSGCQP